ncbi:MAG TPA: hypothetical protein VF773_15980 [Verrucomicrobiae bacterium]
MKTIVFSALIVIGVLAILVFLLLLFIGWVARKEPDSNGDPERDAGLTDEQIAAQYTAKDEPGIAYMRKTMEEAPRESNGTAKLFKGTFKI